jgi:signal transduction histidine kinase/CheY-like chemotaxis protein
MWFFACTLIVMIFIAYRYFYVSISGIKLRNQELVQQADELNKQLDLLNERERKARREADIISNAKDKLLSLMSHKIRTPMNGVIGMANLLAVTDLNSEQREYAETILDCSETLLTNVNEILISDMLDFSKVDSESLELTHKNFDLRNCIEEVLGMFANRAAEAGIDLVYQIDNNVPIQITGDYKRLQQVLINLVENAVKFTDKGEVFIGVSVITNISADQLKLGFTIRDTGSGVPEDKLQYLFKGVLPDNYTTTRKQISKGFGLVICKRVVEQMGGQITLENRPGQGSSFIFSLFTTSSHQAATEFAGNKMIGFEGKQILIVDDNITSNAILNNQLEQWKLLPVLATSGKQALEILSQISVDLVITDLIMPEMDGLQLSQLIKSQYPKIPIILLNTVNDERHKQHPEIFSAVISKPVKQHSLFDTILTELRHSDKSVSENRPSHHIPDNFSENYPLHILVAEDNPVNQKWIKKILSKIGYQCEIAENGKAVLETVSHENFDLILMDVQMPEMDGMEASRMIRVCLETQPVIIAMTANVLQGDREACMQSGMNDYISKPVELHLLLNMLEKWALLIKEKKQFFIPEKIVP